MILEILLFLIVIAVGVIAYNIGFSNGWNNGIEYVAERSRMPRQREHE